MQIPVQLKCKKEVRLVSNGDIAIVFDSGGSGRAETAEDRFIMQLRYR